MSAQAALRFGAGAVALATLPSNRSLYAAAAPELLTFLIGAGDRYTSDDADRLLEEAARFDVLVVGPGLGRDQQAFVARIVGEREGKLLLDADALDALPEPRSLLQRPGDTVITPHAGELRRLAADVPSLATANRVAAESATTVVLKGWPTFVTTREEVVAVTSGGPHLATIGTGDILAGMIGALWAGGLESSIAARSGAYWHGRTAASVAETEVLTADRLLARVGSLPS